METIEGWVRVVGKTKWKKDAYRSTFYRTVGYYQYFVLVDDPDRGAVKTMVVDHPERPKPFKGDEVRYTVQSIDDDWDEYGELSGYWTTRCTLKREFVIVDDIGYREWVDAHDATVEVEDVEDAEAEAIARGEC